jgi:uncharacterized protein YjdB
MEESNMKTKKSLKVICLTISILFSLTVFSHNAMNKVYAATNDMDILITEVMPMAQADNDAYEYIEIYNNSESNIDLKDFRLPAINFDITSSKVIAPKGVLVICTRGNTTLVDFNAFYGTALTADKYMTLPFISEVLGNNSENSVIIAKDNNTVVSRAKYSTLDFELKKAVNYRYPQDGFDMVILGQKQNPSPGVVLLDQVPQAGISVTGVSINKSFVTMEINKNEILYATIEPATAANKAVNWSSSNPAVASVDSKGIVTSKAEGASVITVTTVDGGYTASCVVVVAKIPVTAVTLDKSSLSLEIGKAAVLTATVSPANATNKAVTWKSSNNDIAAVYGEGIVIAKAAGSSVITATTVDGNRTASCTITVNATNTVVSVTGITLDRTTTTLNIGEAMVLEARIIPSNATNKKVTWESSNPEVASVGLNDGVIIPKTAGTTRITATTVDGSYKAYCDITVRNDNTTNIPVSKIKLSSNFIEMIKGETKALKATIYPENATNKAITWSSDNTSVASVDSNGKITALGNGFAIITVKAQDGNLTDRCLIIVKDSKCTDYVKLSLKLNKASIGLKVGYFERLNAIINPAYQKNIALVWKSDNEKVATVSQDGKVYAKKEGKATITVTTKDGKYSAKCTVTVTKVKGNGNGKAKGYNKK